MVRPVAEKLASRPSAVACTVTFMDVPFASAIWQATVRFQMSS